MRWISVLCLALIAFAALPARAGETFTDFQRKLKDIDQDRSASQLPTTDDSTLIIDGKKYQGSALAGYPDAAKSLASACANSHQGLCGQQEKAAKMYDAAAKAVGVPALALVCLTQQESHFIPGQTSSAKAAGLTQFIPETARTLAQAMKSPQTASYKKDWDSYEKLGGTTRSSRSFTSAAMQSKSLKDADVQIFAAAMHFRFFVKGMEPELVEKYKSNSPAGLKGVLNYLLASYNAGGERAKQCFQVKGMNLKTLPAETQGYLKKINACIDKATKGRSR